MTNQESLHEGVQLFQCELGNDCQYVHIVVVQAPPAGVEESLVFSCTDKEYQDLRDWFITAPADPRA